MNGIPSGWGSATLSDLGKTGEQTVLTGPFGSNLGREDFTASGVPIFTIGCLGADGIERSKLLHVPASKADQLAAYRLREGDFLFSRMASVGRAGFVPPDLSGALFNYHLMRLRLNGDVILPHLFYHYVRGSDAVREYLDAVSRGATRDGINTRLLLNMPVLVPPIPEQHRIVAKIDSLSAKSRRARDQLDHIPWLVEKYKQAILAAAFRGELTRRRRTAGVEQWLDTSVDDVARIVFDGPFGSNLKSLDYTAAGVRVVRLENIGHLNFIDDKRTYISLEKYELLKRHTLEADDVLFSSFVAEEVRVAIFPQGQGTAAINKADCFCIRVERSRCLPKFLAFRLATQSAFEHFESLIHGATRPRITLSQLKAFRFSLPNIVEQEEVVRCIEAAFAWTDRLAADAISARKLIDHLDRAVLAKAFRGELVPQDPNDEPASALLERIRAERTAQQPAGNRARGRRKAS
jgi:type I restriction enzyme, S subunit